MRALTSYCFVHNSYLLRIDLPEPDPKIKEVLRFFHQLSETDKFKVIDLLESFFKDKRPLIAAQIRQSRSCLSLDLQDWFTTLENLSKIQQQAVAIWLSRYCADPEKGLAMLERLVEVEPELEQKSDLPPIPVNPSTSDKVYQHWLAHANWFWGSLFQLLLIIILFQINRGSISESVQTTIFVLFMVLGGGFLLVVGAAMIQYARLTMNTIAAKLDSFLVCALAVLYVSIVPSLPWILWGCIGVSIVSFSAKIFRLMAIQGDPVILLSNQQITIVHHTFWNRQRVEIELPAIYEVKRQPNYLYRWFQCSQLLVKAKYRQVESIPWLIRSESMVEKLELRLAFLRPENSENRQEG